MRGRCETPLLWCMRGALPHLYTYEQYTANKHRCYRREVATSTKTACIVVCAILPAFRRLRRGDCKFKDSLGYLARFSLKTKYSKTKQSCFVLSLFLESTTFLMNHLAHVYGIIRKVSSSLHGGIPVVPSHILPTRV